VASDHPALDLAERVVAIADEPGIQTALIGALAMVMHNVVRATSDADLGVSLAAFDKLRARATAALRRLPGPVHLSR